LAVIVAVTERFLGLLALLNGMVCPVGLALS
jgi:hypothetical protein